MFTSRLRFLTAGESHGPSLTGVLEGMPAGVPLDEETIAQQLARRQRGLGAGGRMKIERDHARITAGVMAGRTTGGPIAFSIELSVSLSISVPVAVPAARSTVTPKVVPE